MSWLTCLCLVCVSVWCLGLYYICSRLRNILPWSNRHTCDHSLCNHKIAISWLHKLSGNKMTSHQVRHVSILGYSELICTGTWRWDGCKAAQGKVPATQEQKQDSRGFSARHATGSQRSSWWRGSGKASYTLALSGSRSSPCRHRRWSASDSLKPSCRTVLFYPFSICAFVYFAQRERWNTFAQAHAVLGHHALGVCVLWFEVFWCLVFACLRKLTVNFEHIGSSRLASTTLILASSITVKVYLDATFSDCMQTRFQSSFIFCTYYVRICTAVLMGMHT